MTVIYGASWLGAWSGGACRDICLVRDRCTVCNACVCVSWLNIYLFFICADHQDERQGVSLTNGMRSVSPMTKGQSQCALKGHVLGSVKGGQGNACTLCVCGGRWYIILLFTPFLILDVGVLVQVLGAPARETREEANAGFLFFCILPCLLFRSFFRLSRVPLVCRHTG